MTDTVGHKRATITGEQAPLRPRTVPDVDPENPPEEFADALKADDFIIYGKASIEKFDTGGENSDVPEILDMEAMERSLDRFFGSKKAPGIISIGHDDIPVGRPLEEYTVDDGIAIEIDGDTYEFEAGDTLTTHIEDGDRDGRPELWMLADLANDTDIARKARLGVLTGEIDGYSVTFGRKAFESEGQGRRVTDLDLFSATLAPGDLVANKGAEFDLAAFKAEMNRYAPTTRADDAEPGLLRAAEDLARDLTETMSQTDDTPDDVDSFLSRLGQKLQGGADGTDEQPDDNDEAGQKSDEDAGQKQPEGDDTSDENPMEDLVAALAEHMNASTDEVKSALAQVGQDMGGDHEDNEDDEDDDDGQKADTDDTDDTDTDTDSVDFGAKLEEHGVITEDELGEKLAAQREEIVDDLGQKLAETNKETVEEIAQKMDTASTPTPAGGSFQDSEDFETHLNDISDKEGW